MPARPEPHAFTLSRLESPVGNILLVTDADGAVRALDFADYQDRMMRLLARHYGEVRLTAGPAPAAVAAALERYFAGDIDALSDLPRATNGTPFQKAVWAALAQIPAGETESYEGLAARIGRPSAVRAVGLANGANPVGVIVPCHRVIGKSGALTGFAGGVERKRWLLEHERKAAG